MPFEYEAGHHCEQLVAGGESADDRNGHKASKYTPAATHATPIQRRRFTRSFRMRLARIVSSTTLAAEAGTAKLRSATCTRAMKAKNETAMQRMDRISSFLLKTVERNEDAAWTSPWRFISKACKRSL